MGLTQSFRARGSTQENPSTPRRDTVNRRQASLCRRVTAADASPGGAVETVISDDRHAWRSWERIVEPTVPEVKLLGRDFGEAQGSGPAASPS